jgi:hypothetical protein
MKVFIAIIFFPLLTFSQSKFDYGRYTKVWVLDKDSSHPKFKIDENNLITNHSPVPISKLKNLSLFIPDSNSIVFTNGNKYILSYLINSSSDTVLIDRCDATIYPVETQILVNSQWKTFQISAGSTCGNSYFKGTLLPKSYYILQIERPMEGNIQTEFRVKLKFDNTEYFSNPTLIKLTKAEIQKAGTTIKPFSM